MHNNDESDSVEVRVRCVRSYTSVREMLEREPLKKILPDTETVERSLEVYKRFYTDGEQRKFGVVAIEVEKL